MQQSEIVQHEHSVLVLTLPMDVNALMKQNFVYRMIFKYIDIDFFTERSLLFYETCFIQRHLHVLITTRRYASAGLCDSSVSARLSVTRWHCVKTKKASVMISSPSGSPTILVF